MFNWLDACLFVLVGGDLIILKEIEITCFERPPSTEHDEAKNEHAIWRLEARGRGEKFDRSRHPQGTEVKAITYSAMQILEDSSTARVKKNEVFVIVDI